jgi:hypothetical protein
VPWRLLAGKGSLTRCWPNSERHRNRLPFRSRADEAVERSTSDIRRHGERAREPKGIGTHLRAVSSQMCWRLLGVPGLSL